MAKSDMRSIGHMGSWERFRLSASGDGTVALHNDVHKRFIRLGSHALVWILSAICQSGAGHERCA